MKKLILFICIAILLFAINNLTHSLFTLWQKRELITKANQELRKLKAENKRLVQQEKAVSDPQFIEIEARNKLLLGKPGEQVIIIPKDLVKKGKNAEAKVEKTVQNWEAWIALFQG